MKELIFFSIAVASGIVVFIVILRRYGSDCIPLLLMYSSIGVGLVVFILLKTLFC